jgi:Protein of unknown function (DUF1554)
MRTSLALAAASLLFAACRTGALNPAACANHSDDWCGQGMYCLKVGDQSRCAPLADAGADGKDDTSPNADVGNDVDATMSNDGALPVDSLGTEPPQDSHDALPGDADSRSDAQTDVPTAPFCGDGVTTAPEECDLGSSLNTGAYGGCTATCKRAPRCGDGIKNGPEECDQGAANKAGAYGQGLCTSDCKNAPYCGDGTRNGAEVCDNGGTGATELGACNPECSGYYEKKIIKPTNQLYTTNLGGPAGADGVCQAEFGAGWKAFLVGGSRRATVTPFKGDGSQDWVIRKYTYYYNLSAELLWRTDDVPLLGVHAGMREAIYADVFMAGNYPWTGWADDWTTLPDNDSGGTCGGWTNVTTGNASFALPDLTFGANEICGSYSFILCAQQ